jgi:MarR family transcriptional regulator, organic hydroperoxide resistance regulator
MELSQETVEALSRHFAAIYHCCHPTYTFSLSHQAVRTLQLIHFQPETTVSDLATHLGCAHNTASEIVHRLAEN